MATNTDKLIPPENLISLDDVRVKLTWIWLIGAGSIFALLVVQSLMHAYGGLTQEAWGWFLPTIMPTLMMITTVLGYTAFDQHSSKHLVRKNFLHVALWLSCGYLVLVSLTVLIQPIAAPTPEERVELMRLSNLWLGPAQGLVTAALGVLFVTKKSKSG